MFEMAEVSRFTIIEDRHQFPVGLRANAANRVMHGVQVVRGKEADFPKRFQVLDDIVKSAIQFSNGPVGVGFHRQEFGGLWVEAAALRCWPLLGFWLRQKNGTFSFVVSHVCPPWGDLVRARSVLLAPGAARWLAFNH